MSAIQIVIPAAVIICPDVTKKSIEKARITTFICRINPAVLSAYSGSITTLDSVLAIF